MNKRNNIINFHIGYKIKFISYKEEYFCSFFKKIIKCIFQFVHQKV